VSAKNSSAGRIK